MNTTVSKIKESVSHLPIKVKDSGLRNNNGSMIIKFKPNQNVWTWYKVIVDPRKMDNDNYIKSIVNFINTVIRGSDL